LPAPGKDIIMIAPGTGIAPARSFLAERDSTGASGKNWLFFGEQHFSSDFLYQVEVQRYLQTGVLNKVSLAFSRDQEQKIYVQHRMTEDREELMKWIDSGAYIYISGSKTMGTDVEDTLQKITGDVVLNQLKTEGRFQKDVY
jgi:sulfite reductase (NADPH) flavoprotein alpha-component